MFDFLKKGANSLIEIYGMFRMLWHFRGRLALVQYCHPKVNILRRLPPLNLQNWEVSHALPHNCYWKRM